jgi:hypothetical protein
MEMRRLLVLFALLSVTAVVPVFLWPDKKGGASDVAVVVAAPPFNASSVTIISWKPRYSGVIVIPEEVVVQGGYDVFAKFFVLVLCRIFFYKGFLSDDECDHLVKLVRIKHYQAIYRS